MTFNIWNYTPPWAARRALIADLIATHQPDVVCLQETRHDFRYERGVGQGEQIAMLTGYTATTHVAQVYVPLLRVDEGLTILTRRPPLTADVVPLRQLPHRRRDENRRICLVVTVEAGGREVTVYNTHFSLDPIAQRRNADDVLGAMARQHTDAPTVLAGDLNAEPGSPALAALTAHLADCWEEMHSLSPGYTYSSTHPVRRIDYILVRKAAVRRIDLVGAQARDGVFASDHLGLIADLDISCALDSNIE